MIDERAHLENGHIDEYFLNLYVDEALSPEEMTAVAKHIAGCATCQSEVADMRQRMELTGREPAGYGPGAHMPEVWLSRYADGESPAAEAALVKAHLANCERCRNEVEETRWFTGELRRAVARRRRPPADPTRGLVTVAMLQARPQFPKGEGDPDILRMMREVLEQDDPEAPEPAPAVAPANDDHRILRPKRPWWTAPVVALAVAAALAVVSLAPLCRGFPGLRACLGEQLHNAGFVQVAQLLMSPTPQPSPRSTLVARVPLPPTWTPVPPTFTLTPVPTRNPDNSLPTLRASWEGTVTATWGRPTDTDTPEPTWNATQLAIREATYVYWDQHGGGAGGGSDIGVTLTFTPTPTRTPWPYPAGVWATRQAATATERTRRIFYPHRIFVPFAGNNAVMRYRIWGMGPSDVQSIAALEMDATMNDRDGGRPYPRVLAAGVNPLGVALTACLLAVAGVAFASGWQLRGRHVSTLDSSERDDLRRHHVSAVIWLNVQNLSGYQRPDPGASLNGRNQHER